jgi:flavorubredoxin
MAVSLFDVGVAHPGQFLDLIEGADALAVGSPTMNGDAVKPVWELLSSLVTLNLRGKVGAAFGNYAWSGEAPKLIAQRLADLKLKVIGEPLRVHLTPTAEDLAACRQLGRAIAAAVAGEG